MVTKVEDRCDEEKFIDFCHSMMTSGGSSRRAIDQIQHDSRHWSDPDFLIRNFWANQHWITKLASALGKNVEEEPFYFLRHNLALPLHYIRNTWAHMTKKEPSVSSLLNYRCVCTAYKHY